MKPLKFKLNYKYLLLNKIKYNLQLKKDLKNKYKKPILNDL